MTLEVRVLYSRGFVYSSNVDKDASVPERPITSEDAAQYEAVLVAMGATKHTTRDGFFYDKQSDSTHTTEYIFRY